MTGWIEAGIAENRLLHDWMLKYFLEHFTIEISDLTHGTAVDGSERLFAALGPFFNKYFRPVMPVK